MKNKLIKIQTKIEKPIKREYEVIIKLVSQIGNCLELQADGASSSFTIFIMVIPNFFGQGFLVAVPDYKFSFFGCTDLTYIKTQVNKFVENIVDCHTISTAIYEVINQLQEDDEVDYED